MQSRFRLPYRPGYTMCLCLSVSARAPQNRTGEVLCLLRYTWEPTHHNQTSILQPLLLPLSIYRTGARSVHLCVCACMHACIRTPHIFIHQLWLMIQKRAGAGKRKRRARQIRSAKPQSRRKFFSVEEERDTDTHQQLILSPRYRGTDGDYQIEWSSPTGCG